MLGTSTGSFTVIDANTAAMKCYWKGAELVFVQSINVVLRRPDRGRVALRVLDPDHVSPPLVQEAKDAINAIYAELTEAGILVSKARNS